MTRDGWTPLQIAWADHSAAQGAHSDAVLDLEDARLDLEAAENDDADPDRCTAARRRLDTATAAADRAAQKLHAAEQVYWAHVRLNRRQAANLASVAPDTWSAYVTREQAPQPDGRDDTGHPYWTELTVRTWLAARPGQGKRTDITARTMTVR
ncbi:hypothetical protein ACIBTV_27695 [Micromonospora sp. NPDC049366]|uniref:hypothetical protein n=1 Tax=Micromonospora sp. NPDC049366 TaxID=3364271 RepID=UPI0037B74D36